MAWKDNLRPASFRGVPFFIDVSQFTGGRRVSFHEFPDRDTPFPEDMGKAGNTFRVEGHILGDDYFSIKTQLIEAAQKAGPGELIHPYYGTQFVQCGSFSVDEDTKEGGFAKISFLFYEAGSDEYPKNVNDKQAILAEKVETALAAAKSDFDDSFSIAKAPGFVVSSARSMVESAATLYENATTNIVATAEGVADLAFGIRNLRAEVNDLIQAPSQLSQRLQDSFGLLEDAIGLPEGKLKAHSKFFEFGSDFLPIVGETPNRERERENRTAFNNLMQRTAIAKAVNQASLVGFDSTDEALNQREELVALIESVLMNATNDDVFSAFEDLNASLVQVLPDSDSDLPNIKKVTPQDTLPSLVLAYDLFMRPEVEEDLILRNNIRNPAFVSGGAELEVLNVGESS